MKRCHFWTTGLLVFPLCLGAAQSPSPDRAELLSLAAQGKADQAWAAWNAQPQSAAHFRNGVALASATRNPARGLLLYRDLIALTKVTDLPAATDLALGAADLLADSPDRPARLTACATLLSMKRTRQGCAETIRAAETQDADQRTRAAYRLANSGLRPTTPGVFDTRFIAVATSLELAQTMTRLPIADRLALLMRAFDDPEIAPQRTAIGLLGDIQAPETLVALQDLQLRADLAPELKTAVLLALARRGDQAALAAITRLLPTMGRDARDAVSALAAAGNRAGLTPDRVLDATEGPDRLRAAERFFDVAPAAASRAVFEALESSDPSVRQGALRTAGAIGLGAELKVASCLTDREPAVRAAAIDAVMQTRDRALPASSAR